MTRTTKKPLENPNYYEEENEEKFAFNNEGTVNM